jgi:hypothetical protein
VELLQTVHDRYLLTILERQLKSVEFMRRLQFMAQNTTPTAQPEPETSTPLAVAADETEIEPETKDVAHHAHS